jgi:secreted Zn-dependent insulinase-like peptidase
MTTSITASELARSLADVLNRAAYQGETFEIERGGRRLVLRLEEQASTLKSLHEALLAHRRRFPESDDAFAEAVKQAREVLNAEPDVKDPWAR